MLLSVAVRILACPEFASSFCDSANELLVLFVNEAEKLYGREIYVYNVHRLIRLAADVRDLGALDEFSAFSFENKLGQLKKMVRKPQYPIQQIVYRLAKKQQSKSVISQKHMKIWELNMNTAVVQCLHTTVAIGSTGFFRQRTTQFLLSQGNSCIITTEGYPILVQNILSSSAEDSGMVVLMCQRYVTAEDAFSYPLPSSRLGIYKVSNNLTELFALPLCSVAKKCTMLPMKDGFIIFPLLH